MQGLRKGGSYENIKTHTVSSFQLIIVCHSMTCTGGCGYSFSASDDGCCDTRNM